MRMPDDGMGKLRRSLMPVCVAMVLAACGGDSGSGGGAVGRNDGTPTVPASLRGVAFGPHVAGTDPDLGDSVPASEVSRLMAILETSDANVRWLRTYGATNGLEHVAEFAHAMGFQIAHGIWLDSDTATNDAEIEAAVEAANAGLVDAIVAGSEVLLRGDLSEMDLIDAIRRVRDAIPADIPVSYADTYHVFLTRPDLIGELDFVCAHMHAYWSGVSIDNAVAALDAWYDALADVADGAAIWVCETGWPTDGEAQLDAVPTLGNAVAYTSAFLSWAESRDVPYFYFEAFDEPWKERLEGAVGDHWGLWDQFGNLKAGMDGPLVRGVRTADTWSGDRVVGGPGTPVIELTDVPAIGTTDNLEGRVMHVDPTVHAVAVYIRVSGRWWTKPTFAAPLTTINPAGLWQADITTGGSDTQATEVAAYLLPLGVAAPRAAGAAQLPSSLASISVASVTTTR